MAFSIIAQATGVSTTSYAISSAINTTGADLLIMAHANYGATTANAASDSKGNTWTALTEYKRVNDGRIRLFYSIPSSVGTNHTFNADTVASSYPAVAVIAVSGAKQTSPFDVENGATTDSAASLTVGSITPNENNELVITALCFQVSHTLTGPTGYTYAGTSADYRDYSGGANFGIALAYQIQTTATATNPVWTPATNDIMEGTVASFKVAGAVAIKLYQLLGVGV